MGDNLRERIYEQCIKNFTELLVVPLELELSMEYLTYSNLLSLIKQSFV